MEKQMTALTSMVDASLVIEKLRVAAEVRQTHLFLNGLKHLVGSGQISEHKATALKKLWKKSREIDLPKELKVFLHDPETDELHRRLVDLEEFADGRVASLIEGHPAYPWFSQIKGVGKENIGKVVAPIRVKPADYLVCPRCHIKYDKVSGLKACPECREELRESPFADTISALRMFAGFAPDEEGKAMRRVKGGGKLSYNSQLRSMCWRLGSSLLKAGLRKKCVKCHTQYGATKDECPKCKATETFSVAISKFGQYYLGEKDKYYQRYENQGVKIVPATSLPKKDDKRYEPEGIISEGHVHNQAMRKMLQLFLACLWLVWREAEGLPVTKPYAIEQLGHNSFIDPWNMVDKPTNKSKP